MRDSVEDSDIKVIEETNEAEMLDAKENNLWQAEIPVSAVAKTNSTVRLSAFDINGQESKLQLADFSPSTVSNYNLAGSEAKTTVNFFGITFEPKNLENRFYLLFIAGLLTSLIIAVALKRHVQHLSLIANSSFVVMFAALLLWVG